MGNDILIYIIALSFAAVGLLTFVGYQVAASRGAGSKLRDRLTDSFSDAGFGVGATGPGRFDQVISQLGEAAARPFMPVDQSRQFVIRRNLARAGIYTPSAVRMVVASKVVCLVLGLIGGYAVGVAVEYPFLLVPVGGLVGYVLPMVWLKLKTRANQAALNNGLPDALDLMIVCVEAGLTVDSAMQRISQEMSSAHPSISRELALAHMETRVGLTRSEALKNMGIRTGNAALQSLASMLVQAERFGTSIADALRVHSETLRLNRQLAAEEIAGKASVKMSFPLVLCIFPCTFIVLAGPTILQLMDSPIFK